MSTLNSRLLDYYFHSSQNNKSWASIVRIVTRLQDGPSEIRFPSNRLWGLPSLQFSEGHVFFPLGKSDRAVKLASHLRLEPNSSEVIILPHPPHPHKASWRGQLQFCSYLHVFHPAVLAHNKPVRISVKFNLQKYNSDTIRLFRKPVSGYIIKQ